MEKLVKNIVKKHSHPIFFVILCIILTLSILFCFTGCIKQEEVPQDNTPEPLKYEVYLVGQENSANFSKIYRIILYPMIEHITVNDKISVTYDTTKILEAPFSEYQDNNRYSYDLNIVYSSIYNPSYNGIVVKDFNQITSVCKNDRFEFYFSFYSSIIMWDNLYDKTHINPHYIYPDMRTIEDKLATADIIFNCGIKLTKNYTISLPLS